MIRMFSNEPEVVDIGSQFLHIISWNFVLSGIIFTCSSMFQALGNTLPSLYSSATRLITYSVPLIWVSTQPWFRLDHVWFLSVGTVILQTIVSFVLLQKQLRRGSARSRRRQSRRSCLAALCGGDGLRGCHDQARAN